jgi:hypothetical protein
MPDLMGSLIEELRRREEAARREADGLREQITGLTDRLERVEERLSRLAITRETVEEVVGEVGAGVGPAESVDAAAPSRFVHLSPIGVVTVPPWREGLDASALPQAYRDLVEVAQDAARPLRAVEFAAAAGLGTDKSQVEGLRSKLKRLVERGWLGQEAGPGLFAVAVRVAPEVPNPPVRTGSSS